MHHEKISAKTPLPEGIDRLLMKPVGKVDLARTVRQLLDQAKAQMLNRKYKGHALFERRALNESTETGN
ncbi:MAG: hypothetical protein HZB87_08560 [Desulfatitalea sp.]|nr:hypothetical protein [Desulfatitalea sp.]